MQTAQMLGLACTKNVNSYPNWLIPCGCFLNQSFGFSVLLESPLAKMKLAKSDSPNIFKRQLETLQFNLLSMPKNEGPRTLSRFGPISMEGASL